MIRVFLLLWIISALMIVIEKKTVRIIIYLGVFSLLSSICFYLLAAPDVAMAEVTVSVFLTIFYIICLEKYYVLGADSSDSQPSGGKLLSGFIHNILPICFTGGLILLVLYFMPDNPADEFLKERYFEFFRNDVGGENAVTSIYLGYRMYDTLFEALMLLISVVAVAHLSWFETAADSKRKAYHVHSHIALPIMRIISPLMLLIGIYLIMNGHLSPGGGFQGGVVIAAFFICRYLVFDIYDIQITRFVMIEKLVYIGIVLLAALYVFVGFRTILPIDGNVYLILMNSLIGMKIAWGFIIILYRYIAFERR